MPADKVKIFEWPIIRNILEKVIKTHLKHWFPSYLTGYICWQVLQIYLMIITNWSRKQMFSLGHWPCSGHQATDISAVSLQARFLGSFFFCALPPQSHKLSRQTRKQRQQRAVPHIWHCGTPAYSCRHTGPTLGLNLSRCGRACVSGMGTTALPLLMDSTGDTLGCTARN